MDNSDLGRVGDAEQALVNQAPSGLGRSGFDPSRDDPAYAEPLPAAEFLDRAAQANGFADWFAVPAMFRTPQNRRIIVEARVLERGGRYEQAPPLPREAGMMREHPPSSELRLSTLGDGE